MVLNIFWRQCLCCATRFVAQLTSVSLVSAHLYQLCMLWKWRVNLHLDILMLQTQDLIETGTIFQSHTSWPLLSTFCMQFTKNEVWVYRHKEESWFEQTIFPIETPRLDTSYIQTSRSIYFKSLQASSASKTLVCTLRKDTFNKEDFILIVWCIYSVQTTEKCQTKAKKPNWSHGI